MENLQEIIKRINNRKDLAKYSDIKSKIIYGSMIDTAEAINTFMHDAFILDPDLKNNFDNGYLEIINMCWKVFFNNEKICKLDKEDEYIINDFETYDIESYDSYLDYLLQTKLNIELTLSELHGVNLLFKEYMNVMAQIYESENPDYKYKKDYTNETEEINTNFEKEISKLGWECEDKIIRYIEKVRRKYFIRKPNIRYNFEINFRGTMLNFWYGALKIENLYSGYNIYEEAFYRNKYSKEKRKDYFNYYLSYAFELKFSKIELDEIFNIFDKYIEEVKKLLNK